jgi:hypothetical protein
VSARDALRAMRERAEAATEGPWSSHEFGYPGESEPSSIVVHTGAFDWNAIRYGETERIASLDWDAQEGANAEFIAHARTDLPALVGALEAVETLVHFDECHHTVVDEDGHEGPCDRTAFALRVDPEGGPYPVCIEHAAQGPLLALGQIRDLIEAALEAP